MKEVDYINVSHLQNVRAAISALGNITPALLPTDESRASMVQAHRGLNGLVDELRKQIKIDPEEEEHVPLKHPIDETKVF